MTVAPFIVATLVAVAGWGARRSRAAPRRPTQSGGGEVTAQVAASVAWLRRHLSGSQRVSDPSHLLRFRTAIDRGASVVQAFESASTGPGRWPAGARRLVARVSAGASIQAALDAWIDEDPDPSIRLLGDALAISSTTGGSHLRAVDAVIGAVRDRAALEREVRALASQAQTSAVVLVVMPVGFALAIAVLDARVRMFFVGSMLGPACIAGGGVLDAVGGWLMMRMVRRVV